MKITKEILKARAGQAGIWALARMQEPSTAKAVVTVGAGLVGAHIAPEYSEHITTVAMLLAGGIAVATKEQPPQ